MENQKIVKLNRVDHSIIDIGYKLLSKLTQKAYTNDLNTFNKIINKDIREVNAGDILKYIETLKDREYKQSSINRKIYSLSKVLNLYKLQGLIKSNVISELNKIRKVTKRIENNISISVEISDIKNVITQKVNKTNTIIEILAATGLRISELTGIKVKDIKAYCKNGQAYREIEITGKGNKQRKIFITESMYLKIKDIFGKSKQGFLFQSKSGKELNTRNLYKQIKREFKRHTGKDVHPHMLRHFYCDFQINTLKRNPKAVSVYAGHSSINITYDFYVKPKFDNPALGILAVA